MTTKTTTRQTRNLQVGLSAAVLGTLAATFTAAPADAAPLDRAPIERNRGGTPMRAVPATHTVPPNHVVQPGDTVAAIASHFGLRTVDVLTWNGLSWRSVIYPGQTLTLQATAPVPSSATAASPARSAPSHTVVAGDTVFDIAHKYGTTTENLFALNGLGPTSIIYPGQTLAVQATSSAATTTVPAESQRTASLTSEQEANAALIIRVGRELGVSDRAIALALATGMVESELRNLDWGDRDSLGIFQQRPSYGWGTPAQILDAERSIRVFYGGRHDPNGQATRGLLDITGWQNLPFSSAAQAVQISAYPDKYGQWEAQAYAWLALYR